MEDAPQEGLRPLGPDAERQGFIASREIEAILDNTDFMVLLSQAQSDRAILAKQLGISEHQLSYITHSNSGEGLLFYGSTTIPFVDRFPKGEIYDLLTTRPEDLKNEPERDRGRDPRQDPDPGWPLTGSGRKGFLTPAVRAGAGAPGGAPRPPPGLEKGICPEGAGNHSPQSRSAGKIPPQTAPEATPERGPPRPSG